MDGRGSSPSREVAACDDKEILQGREGDLYDVRALQETRQAENRGGVCRE
jgi:hypothetical protein